MQVIKKTHPITGSFLLQLDIAMKSSGRQGDLDAIVETGIVQELTHETTQSHEVPQLPDNNIMADELKQYNALPIALHGILPTRMQQGQGVTGVGQGTAPESYVLEQAQMQDFSLVDLSGWQSDDISLLQTDLAGQDFSNNYFGPLNDAQYDDVDLELLLDPLQLRHSPPSI